MSGTDRKVNDSCPSPTLAALPVHAERPDPLSVWVLADLRKDLILKTIRQIG